MMKIFKFIILKLKRYWFFIIYLFIIFLLIPLNQSLPKQIGFIFYVLFIFLLIQIILILKYKTVIDDSFIKIKERRKFFATLLIFSLLLIFITRLLPFWNFGETPLGYDTGFYVRDIEKINFTVTNKKGIYPERAFYFIFIPLNLVGLPATSSLHLVYIIFQFLLVGALYFFFRSLKSKFNFEYACIAVFIFATSATQFHAYWSMFPKQILAIALFLFSIGLILRKSNLSVVTIILGSLINIPTFAVFAIGALLYFIVKIGKIFFQKIYSNRALFLCSIFAFGLLFFYLLTKMELLLGQSSETYAYLIRRSLYYGRWIIIVPVLIFLSQFFLNKKIINNKILYITFFFFAIWNIFYWAVDYRLIISVIDYLVIYKGMATNFPVWQMPEIKGIFINVFTFRNLNMLIIPFSLIGVLQPHLWNQEEKHLPRPLINILIFLYALFVILFILVSFPFIYQYRFVIIFDIFFIIFAVPTFFLLTNYFLKEKRSLILVSLFILVYFGSIIYLAQNREPHIYSDELNEIKALSRTTEDNALILATSNVYTPWVIGFSGRRAHGPGYGGDTWSSEDWLVFWSGNNEAVSYKLLNQYEQPLYIFISSRQLSESLQEFVSDNKNFEPISLHVWKYKKLDL